MEPANLFPCRQMRPKSGLIRTHGDGHVEDRPKNARAKIVLEMRTHGFTKDAGHWGLCSHIQDPDILQAV